LYKQNYRDEMKENELDEARGTHASNNFSASKTDRKNSLSCPAVRRTKILQTDVKDGRYEMHIFGSEAGPSLCSFQLCHRLSDFLKDESFLTC
jgi:hypothetical protein